VGIERPKIGCVSNDALASDPSRMRVTKVRVYESLKRLPMPYGPRV